MSSAISGVPLSKCQGSRYAREAGCCARGASLATPLVQRRPLAACARAGLMHGAGKGAHLHMCAISAMVENLLVERPSARVLACSERSRPQKGRTGAFHLVQGGWSAREHDSGWAEGRARKANGRGTEDGSATHMSRKRWLGARHRVQTACGQSVVKCPRV